MTERAPHGGWPEPDEDWDREPEGRCSVCGGDGWTECDDPIQCTYVHDDYGEHRCPSCGGSGLQKDMTLW